MTSGDRVEQRELDEGRTSGSATAGNVFLGVGILVVGLFLWSTARNANRYAESLEPPPDLRRAGDPPNPAGGSPSGGNIWPSE